MISSFVKTMRFVVSHPLNRDQKTTAVLRFIRWQVGSRILPGPVAVPFVNNTRLLVSPSMKGATGNVYCGLQEFEEMAFILHVLRVGDLFVDIGANIGSYSILAASVGAHVIGFEPIPSTFDRFRDNITINQFDGLISPRNQGVGSRQGTLRFTSGFDTVNHVATETETDALVEVESICLDSLWTEEESPTIMKIDVEGFELSVLEGAPRVLKNGKLVAVILELNRSGRRYGVDDRTIYSRMKSFGFDSYNYQPFERALIPLIDLNQGSGNIIFIKNDGFVTERIGSAPRVVVNGVSF